MKRRAGSDIEGERISIVRCPYASCGTRFRGNEAALRKRGHYRTRWNGRWARRYRCGRCERSFSAATFRPSYRQHRPDLNAQVLKLYSSGMTQRRMAIVLGVNRKTIVRKFLYLAVLARKAHADWLVEKTPSSVVQFDEMETFEHSRLKPVSVALAVDEKTRNILSFAVEPMGYKGRLAHVARRKYGPRKDHSARGVARVLARLAQASSTPLVLVTDDSPHYPKPILSLLPEAIHRPVRRIPPVVAKRRRNLNDPLFALNVTAAKLRNDLSRLGRKTWVTTKKLERLDAHLALYLAWNNGYRLPA